MRTVSELILLIVACAAVFLSGSDQTPFYTRGEAREALVVREVLETGEWIVPRRPNGELTRKPPLYYWSGAAISLALPDAPELAARMPSAIGGTIGVLATWATARAVFGVAAGLPSGLILATSFEWLRASTRARVDMTLTGALAVLLLMWVGLARDLSLFRSFVAFGAATVAILAKGPVALVIPALAATVAWLPNVRRFGLVRFAIPLILAAGTAGLWYLVAYLDQGDAFLQIVRRENWDRFVDASGAQIGHAHGIAYLLSLTLVGLLPWTLLLPLAAGAVRDWRRPGAAMLVSWVIVTVLFFSVASGKRGVYLLPAYPAIAILIGAGVVGAPGERSRRIARMSAMAYLPGLVLVAIGMLAYGLGFDPGTLVTQWMSHADRAVSATLAETAGENAVTIVGLALASILAGIAIERLRRREEWGSMTMVLGAFLIGLALLFQTTIHPTMARHKSPAGFLHALERQLPEDVPIYSFPPIDSVVRFYSPRRVELIDRNGKPHPGHVVAWEKDLARRLDANGRPLEIVARSRSALGRRGALAIARFPPGPIGWVPREQP